MAKKNHLFVYLLVFGVSFTSLSQNGNFTMGARSAGMANASTTLSDEWSSFNNIGGLSYVESISVFATYRNQYEFPEFSTMAVGFVVPVFNGTATVGAFRFGDDLFNQQRVNLGFSNRFGIVSLGANVSYYQVSIQEGGTGNAFLFDFGGHAKLSEQFYFAAHISNLNQAEISEITSERVPTYMKAGISYRPINQLMLNTELEKSIDEDVNLKLGLEYEIVNKVFIRSGIITEPFMSHFGMGFDPGRLAVDYAYSNHSELGGIHQFSFIYRIKK